MRDKNKEVKKVILGQLVVLRDIIENRYNVRLSKKCKTNELVMLRAIYYGLASDLFFIEQEVLAESISKKRGTVTHALLNIYPNLKAQNKSLFYDIENIVKELDKKLGTNHYENYIPSRFRNIIKELKELPIEATDRVRTKIEAILKYEKLLNENQ